MQVIEKSECISYIYESNKEFLRHKLTMQESGWLFKDTFILNEKSICATYIKNKVAYHTTLRDINYPEVVEKLMLKNKDNDILYNDSVVSFKNTDCIANRLLLDKRVINYEVQGTTLIVTLEI